MVNSLADINIQSRITILQHDLLYNVFGSFVTWSIILKDTFLENLGLFPFLI